MSESEFGEYDVGPAALSCGWRPDRGMITVVGHDVVGSIPRGER
jgi:hypothetical protein